MSVNSKGKLNILSVSFQDLRKPFHGGSRLVLSSLGALALAGHKVLHVGMGDKKYHVLSVTDGKRKATIKTKKVFDGNISQAGWFKYKRFRAKILSVIEDEPDIIICESRPLFLLCSELSRALKIPWVIRVDALRSLFCREIYRITRRLGELIIAPWAITSYVWITKRADLGICVSKILERKLRQLLVSNIRTVRPTHLTLVDENPQLRALDLIPEDFVLYSGPLKVLFDIASKASKTAWVTIRAKVTPFSPAKPKLANNIIQLGGVSDQELTHVYERAKCVLIYRSWPVTGISMTLVEALRFGKPSIVNSNAIIGLEDSANLGKVIVEDNILKWPDFIAKLNSESFKQERELAAKRYYKLNLSPEIHASHMENCFLEVLSINK